MENVFTGQESESIESTKALSPKCEEADTSVEQVFDGTIILKIRDSVKKQLKMENSEESNAFSISVNDSPVKSIHHKTASSTFSSKPRDDSNVNNSDYSTAKSKHLETANSPSTSLINSSKHGSNDHKSDDTTDNKHYKTASSSSSRYRDTAKSKYSENADSPSTSRTHNSKHGSRSDYKSNVTTDKRHHKTTSSSSSRRTNSSKHDRDRHHSKKKKSHRSKDKDSKRDESCREKKKDLRSSKSLERVNCFRSDYKKKCSTSETLYDAYNKERIATHDRRLEVLNPIKPRSTTPFDYTPAAVIPSKTTKNINTETIPQHCLGESSNNLEVCQNLYNTHGTLPPKSPCFKPVLESNETTSLNEDLSPIYSIQESPLHHRGLKRTRSLSMESLQVMKNSSHGKSPSHTRQQSPSNDSQFTLKFTLPPHIICRSYDYSHQNIKPIPQYNEEYEYNKSSFCDYFQMECNTNPQEGINNINSSLDHVPPYTKKKDKRFEIKSAVFPQDKNYSSYNDEKRRKLENNNNKLDQLLVDCHTKPQEKENGKHLTPPYSQRSQITGYNSLMRTQPSFLSNNTQMYSATSNTVNHIVPRSNNYKTDYVMCGENEPMHGKHNSPISTRISSCIREESKNLQNTERNFESCLSDNIRVNTSPYFVWNNQSMGFTRDYSEEQNQNTQNYMPLESQQTGYTRDFSEEWNEATTSYMPHLSSPKFSSSSESCTSDLSPQRTSADFNEDDDSGHITTQVLEAGVLEFYARIAEERDASQHEQSTQLI